MKNFELKDNWSADENYACDFPIDLVILWCDDTPDFRAKRIYWQNKLGLQQNQNIISERFETVDELKYLLRSVEMYAPWINHIFLVTDNQCPTWLNLDNPKITIVDHKEILPLDVLPTFNSYAIEAYLHKTPHLSEHFIYANDDMLFSQPVSPQFFFDRNGNPIIRLREDFSFVDNNHARVILHSYDLVEQKYKIKFKNRYHLHHCTDAYRKSYYADVFEKFKSEFEQTGSHQFRQDTDAEREIMSLCDILENRATLKLLNSGNTDSNVIWTCSSNDTEKSANTKLICVNMPSQYARSYLSYNYPAYLNYERVNKTTLTIITVCYNIKNEIERTCNSIVNQTWQDFEWIVVDGGSTDGTVDILKKYAYRIDKLISEKDSGIYNAMNKGIKLAHGEWLSFMNGGDCFAARDVLEKVFADKEYNADILYGYMKMFNSDGYVYLNTYPDTVSKAYFYDNVIGHQGAFIKRKLFDKYGLYNENYRIVSDWEKWIIFAHHKRKFEPLKFPVASFWLGGIGCHMNKRHLAERADVIYQHFSRCKEYDLFNYIPLLSIEEK